MDELARIFPSEFRGDLDPPKCLYICFCKYNKMDDSVSYFLDKFRLGPVLSPGHSPSFKNFFIEDYGETKLGFFSDDGLFDDQDILFQFSRSLLEFPDQNRPSGFDFCRCKPRIQMGFSAITDSSFILAGGVVGKFQPLRMGFDSYPSSEAYCVDFGGYQILHYYKTLLGGYRLLRLNKEVRQVPDLLQGKVQPLLVQLGGKIYALAGNAVSYPTSPYFEVLDLGDRSDSDWSWSSLPDPPVFHRYSTNNDASSTDITFYPEPPSSKDITYAVAGSNILVSSSYTPTFRFDTAEPTKGWRELLLSDGGKFEFHGTTLVVDTGHHSLLFAYGGDFRRLRLACHLTISVHMMSNTFDLILPIAPLRLPEDQLPDEFRIYPPDGYTFLDLGDGTICLLLSRFMGPFSKFEHETARMILLLVKFQINTTENKVKFLATHTIEYRHSERSSAGTEDIEMMGAFLR